MFDESCPSDISVHDWFDAFDPESSALGEQEWQLRRLERLHAIQVSIDGVAYAHNIPLRLLRLRNLLNLDETFVRFINSWESQIFQLFIEECPDRSRRTPPALSEDDARTLIQEMKNPKHVRTLQEWVLLLASPSVSCSNDQLTNPPLPKHYAEWFLMLLPHLERDVWLTEMGNPLPVHNLARMVEHWALYVLMWAWEKAKEIHDGIRTNPESQVILDRALNIKHLELMVLPAYKRKGRSTKELDVVMLVGPYVKADAVNADDGGAWFHTPFQRYLERVANVDENIVKGWDEIHEKAPGVAELADALEARAALPLEEARRRAIQSQAAWRELLSGNLHSSLMKWPNGEQGRPLSRANWETMTVMACWKARWEKILVAQIKPQLGVSLRLHIPRHRVQGQIGPAELVRNSGRTPLRFHTSDLDLPRFDLEAAIEEVRQCTDNTSVWIESLATLQARLRERQQAGWAAYITAINHLLARHTLRERAEGDDDPSALMRAPPTCEEVDHLLRGFGGRICRYLIGMARADLAEIYWLDYSNLTPRLRHVGSAERLIQHRAKRQKIWTDFNLRIWAPCDIGQPSHPSDSDKLDQGSRYMIYRAVSSGHIEPRPADRKAAIAQNESGPRAVTDFYDDSVPLRDYLAVPLVFNNRTVGLLAMAGVASTRHFDTRMHPWLHTLSQDLGQTMYFHSQVWQMRQMNWLASNVPLEKWQAERFGEIDNPLVSVARCLANIFLCPGVLIWLKNTQNNKKFSLAGCTAPELYLSGGQTPDHAPSVELCSDRRSQGSLLSRPIFAFALDQWESRTESDGGFVAGTMRGRFVQACFDAKLEKTQDYELKSAESGKLTLGWDFLSSTNGKDCASPNTEALPNLRNALFDTRGWINWMSFALVTYSSNELNVIGAVSLHGAASITPDNISEVVERRMAWPPGWRPAVAHVQTYLPYILTQTEAIERPLSQLVQYLLHQGRNELNAASIKADDTRRLLHKLLAADGPAGQIQRWLRDRSSRNDVESAPELTSLLEQFDRLRVHAQRALEVQSSVEHAESLTTLWRLIENRRAIAALGHQFANAGDAHRVRWIDLAKSIHDAIAPFEADILKEHIFRSIDKDIDGWLIMTQPRLWSWLLSDLLHNIAKYASASSSFEVKFLSEPDKGRLTHYRLQLINEAEYDPEVDNPDQLKRFGVCGSAGLARQHRKIGRDNLSRIGTGIGLWGVDQLSKILRLTFDIQIRPLIGIPGRARYHFGILIPKENLRRNDTRFDSEGDLK